MQAYRATEARSRRSSADVFELWGDTPIFPGPSWRVAWPLPDHEQQQLNELLSNGGLWKRLQTTCPDFEASADPWQPAESLGEEAESSALQAIRALAALLLRPGVLEICSPFLPVKLNPACLVLRSDQHELAGQALNLAAELTRAAWMQEPGAGRRGQALRAALADLKAKVRICCDHPLTAAQLAEARRRGIPAFLIDPGQRLYQLGTGSHSRWISSTSNDHDSAFGVAIARDKSKTRELLRQLGLPVPEEIRLPLDVSDSQLRAAATRIGYPCVLKPQDAEQGRGVTANITADSELLAASQKAREHAHKTILLQKHVNGADFRLNVIRGRLVFVLKRTPPSITGNGVNTVQELIELENIKRLERNAAGQIAGEIDLRDPEVVRMLSRAGLALRSRPAVGRHVWLRGNSNVSTGGLREEIDPACVHPVIRRQCKAIASSLRLEICGIDYITTDISESPDQCLGAFIEVNSMPQSDTDMAPSLLDNLFDQGCQHSVATSVIIADWQQLPVARLTAELGALLNTNSQVVIGIPASLKQQIWPLLGREERQYAQLYSHPREVLLNHAISHAIYLTSSDLTLSRGLPAFSAVKLILLDLSDQLQPAPAWQHFFQSRVNTNGGYASGGYI